MRLSIFLFGAAMMLGAAPAITGVYNAGSWIPPSLPNSGVAQGAYFKVTGSGLGPSSLVVAPSYPLPTTQGLGGTVVQVTVGAVTQTCILYYTSATQVSGIVPSTTPVGNGTLTVSYQGVSPSAAIQVVAASFGMFTLNSAGAGPASITDVNYHPITMINAALSGDTIVLWGTGLGAVTGDETEPPVASKNFPGVEVLIGTQLVPPLYAGRSSYPGLDQVNVVIPAGFSYGCKTSIAVVVNGVTGNVVSTSIGPAGQTTCDDAYGALSAANLQKAASSGALNIGAVDVSRIGTNDDVLAGSFGTYPVNSLIRSYAGSYGPSIGGCVVYEQVPGGTLILTDPVLAALPHLDPGPALVLTPQTGKAVTVNATFTGVFGGRLGTTGNVYISPSTYSVANGNGGSDVAAFNWSDTLPNPVAFGNLPASVSRALNLTVSWTGSSPFTVVTIFGYPAVPLDSTHNSFVEFVCTVPAASKQFTIPSAIMSMLPVNGCGAQGVMGVGFQIAGVVDNRFAAAGLDAGLFTVFTSTGPVLKVQ